MRVFICSNGHENGESTPVCRKCGASTEEWEIGPALAEAPDRPEGSATYIEKRDDAQTVIVSLQDREAILLKWLATIRISDNKDQKACEEMLIHARQVKRDAETKLQELLQPVREEHKRITDLFKPFMDKLTTGIDSVNRALQLFHEEQAKVAETVRLQVLTQQAQAIALSRVTGEVVELPKQPLPVMAKTFHSGMGSVTYRDDFIFQIVNPDLVPRDLCEPSKMKIRARIKSGIRDIPGVVIATKYTTVARGASGK
jgi:hypothetical protein